jgi:hypothetical protein
VAEEDAAVFMANTSFLTSSANMATGVFSC